MNHVAIMDANFSLCMYHRLALAQLPNLPNFSRYLIWMYCLSGYLRILIKTIVSWIYSLEVGIAADYLAKWGSQNFCTNFTHPLPSYHIVCKRGELNWQTCCRDKKTTAGGTTP